MQNTRKSQKPAKAKTPFDSFPKIQLQGSVPYLQVEAIPLFIEATNQFADHVEVKSCIEVLEEFFTEFLCSEAWEESTREHRLQIIAYYHRLVRWLQVLEMVES